MKYALITGSSKGIGKSIAFELAKNNMGVLLVARSGEILKQVSSEIASAAKTDARFLPIDLSEPGSIAKLYDWVIDQKVELSILVNNAGYGLWGYFDQVRIDEQINMIRLNVTALVELTHRLIPVLRENSPSYILNVSSTTAYQPVPTLSVYAATKSFVLSFSHSLRHELINSGISVSCLSPGSTDTNFMDRAGMEEVVALKKMADKFSMSPEKVAKIAVAQLLKKKAEIIPGKLNTISSKISNLLPTGISAKTAASIYEKHLK